MQGGGQGPKPKPSYTATASFLDDLSRVIEMAQALGAPELADLVAQRASLMSKFVANYNMGGYFGTSPTDGAQTANAFALAIGAPAAKDTQTIVDYIVADIAAHAGHAAVGIIGTKYLTRALTAHGNAWLAMNTTLQTDYRATARGIARACVRASAAPACSYPFRPAIPRSVFWLRVQPPRRARDDPVGARASLPSIPPPPRPRTTLIRPRAQLQRRRPRARELRR